MLAVFVPILVFLICQIRVRSFWDLNNAVLGLLYSLIGAAVFQVFLKWLIGGVSLQMDRYVKRKLMRSLATPALPRSLSAGPLQSTSWWERLP
jgi:uncharacterized membrane protein